MALIKELLIQPLSSTAVLAAMAAIAWSLLSLRRTQGRHSRILLAIVGFASVMHGLRIVLLIHSEINFTDGVINLTVALLYLASLEVINRLSRSHRSTQYALRLAEGNQALPYSKPVTMPPAEDPAKGVFDAVPAPMFAVDLDGQIRCWNLAAERALGWKRDEVLGRRLPDLLIQGGSDSLDIEAPIRLMRKDGAPIDHPVRSVPIRDPRGTVNGILTILST